MWGDPRQLFEIEGRDRLLPMEGMRGLAVLLVFCQHFGMQFTASGHLSGVTAMVGHSMRQLGNYGVELFFVLSGFLIYGILLRKRPAFLDFMFRRGQRLYPAFLAAFLLACLLDLARPQPYIPHQLLAGAGYIAANLLFLPGLFPITPISAVNWSLSYEWWFYATCTALFASFGLARFGARVRVPVIIALAVLLIALSAAGIANVPIRGLSLLFGMLLAEAAHHKLHAANPWVAVSAVLVAFVVAASGAAPGWLIALCLATGFALLCSATFFRDGFLSRLLSRDPIRWLGNMSYSFYLVHGMVVVTVLHVVLARMPAALTNLAFWVVLLPLFALAFAVSAGLFLAIEKPLSLQRRPPRAVAASEGTIAG